ncbi:MAG: DNA polymerase III subunit alpha, partial [Acidobacteriota bacterium]
MEPTFVHLHNHSEYSILDGCLKVLDLVQAAYANNMPAVAMTDHGNIFGAVQFYKEARARGVKPILGCEVYVAPGSRFDKKPGNGNDIHHFHLVLLVRNAQGYRNLCHLLTQSYLEGFYYRPRIDKELLAAHAEGLIGLSACLKGELNVWLGRGFAEKAEDAAREYAAIFAKGDYYVELMDHGLAEQKALNPLLIGLARKLDLPLVVTNDVHFAKREDAQSQDVLVCIQTNRKISDPDRLKFSTDQFYFKSAAEMAALFPDVPEAVENTGRIAARCELEFPAKTYFLPNFTPPEGRTLSDYFEAVAWDGFRKRMEKLAPRIAGGELAHAPEDYEARMEREIKLIKQMRFEGYFLIVWDLLNAARKKGIPVGPGRGSAAGSLLAYSLEITEIDPLEYDLLFERFLNPERISLPDIDMDFCARRRQEMIEYVTKKYGQENVCQIITFGTMAARGAIRDVGRVLEVPLPEVDRIAKMVPFGPDSTIAEALKNVPELRELRDKNAKVAQLLAIAQGIEGQVRHPSIHAAGIVITPRPLVEFLPLCQSSKGEITTQFAMGDVEAIGLLKMDFLGLRNLSTIERALELIAENTGERPDIDRVPLDDPEVYAMLTRGDSMGIFQLEGGGMRALMRSLRPDRFEDIIALVSLYRPGPLGAGTHNLYADRKNGRVPVEFPHPDLAGVLSETYGIMVYQEQVMQAAEIMAGYSMVEADTLRKAMGKKIPAVMARQEEQFFQGCAAKGHPPALASRLFADISHFAGYGFNKSHAAGYALIAYQTAWLKAHYPAEYMAALLTSAKRDKDRTAVYLNECRAMGLRVAVPDVNRSESDFVARGGVVLFGLSAVRNVGEGVVDLITRERVRNGPFADFVDFVRRVDMMVLNKRTVESLIKAGAFDTTGAPRKGLLLVAEQVIDAAVTRRRAEDMGQYSLFGAEDTSLQTESVAVPETEWDKAALLSFEKEMLGLYVSDHPLFGVEAALRAAAT